VAKNDGLRDTERAFLPETRSRRKLADFLRVSNTFGELSVFSQAANVHRGLPARRSAEYSSIWVVKSRG